MQLIDCDGMELKNYTTKKKNGKEKVRRHKYEEFI